MLREIYHLLPPEIWMIAFIVIMIFMIIPIYCGLALLVDAINILIEKVKCIYYDVKRRKRTTRKDDKSNS